MEENDVVVVENPKLVIHALKCDENRAAFEQLMENKQVLEKSCVTLKWLSKDEMLSVSNPGSKLKQSFVIPSFDDDPVYQHLHRLNYMIWGSKVVEYCIRTLKPLPDKPLEIYSMAFKDISVSFTGLPPEIKEVEKRRVELMGGTVFDDFSMSVDFLIARNAEFTPKYKGALAWNKPICHVRMIGVLWNDGTRHVTERVNSERNEFPVGILVGCVVSISGIDVQERTRIAEVIERNGGVYMADMDRDTCTHLIADKTGSDKYKFALKWNIRPVTSRWLRKCLDRKVRVPEEYYHTDPVLRKRIQRAESNVEKGHIIDDEKKNPDPIFDDIPKSSRDEIIQSRDTVNNPADVTTITFKLPEDQEQDTTTSTVAVCSGAQNTKELVDFVISSEQVTQPAASILDIAGISEDQIKAESRQKSLNGKSDSTMTNAGDSSDLAYDTDPAFINNVAAQEEVVSTELEEEELENDVVNSVESLGPVFSHLHFDIEVAANEEVETTELEDGELQATENELEEGELLSQNDRLFYYHQTVSPTKIPGRAVFESTPEEPEDGELAITSPLEEGELEIENEKTLVGDLQEILVDGDRARPTTETETHSLKAKEQNHGSKATGQPSRPMRLRINLKTWTTELLDTTRSSNQDGDTLDDSKESLSPDYIRTAMLDAAKKQDDKAKAPLSTRNENVTKEHQPNENAFLAPQFSPMSVDEDDASVDQENKQGQY